MMTYIRQTSLSLDHEDIVKLRARGVNISKIVRSIIKSYIGTIDNKKDVDIVGVLQRDKIDLMGLVEDLTTERNELKKKLEKMEEKLEARKIMVYR